MEKDKIKFLVLSFKCFDKAMEYVNENLKIAKKIEIEEDEVKVTIDCSEELKKILNEKDENLTFICHVDDWRNAITGIEFITTDLDKIINFLRNEDSLNDYTYITVWKKEKCILEYGIYKEQDCANLVEVKIYIEENLAKVESQEDGI